jgi:hypothetical protein
MRTRQVLHFVKDSRADLLDNQLSNAVTAFDVNWLGRVVVDEQDGDFTAVTSINRSGGVDHAKPMA